MHSKFAYFYFVLIHLELKTIKTFVHVRSRSFLENDTRFQTKICKVFSDHQNGRKNGDSISLENAHHSINLTDDVCSPSKPVKHKTGSLLEGCILCCLLKKEIATTNMTQMDGGEFVCY